MKIGTDCIGVGVGAIILNSEGKILLGKRGPRAKNEKGLWEIPGGTVEFGETCKEALVREVQEEIGVTISVEESFNTIDHILPEENQHWVAQTFICKIIDSTTPKSKEPEKMSSLGWFSLEEAKNLPLSSATKVDLEKLRKKKG